MQDIENELGGVDGFFVMFAVHYCNMFANPRMLVLFDTRHEDTNVCAYEHGRRVASLVLDRWHSTSRFDELNRGFFTSAIEKAH